VDEVRTDLRNRAETMKGICPEWRRAREPPLLRLLNVIAYWMAMGWGSYGIMSKERRPEGVALAVRMGIAGGRK